MSIDPTQLAQPLSQLLVQALTPLIEQLPPEVVQLLLGSPIIDYRYALQQIYQTEQLGFEAVEESLNIIIQMIQQQNPTLQAIQTQTKPVTLPTPAPSGYGGPALSDIGDEVWTYPVPSAPGYQMQQVMSYLNSVLYTFTQGDVAFSAPSYPGYLVTVGTNIGDVDVRGPTNSVLDFSTILATDASILAWARRVYPSTTWLTFGDDVVYEQDAGASRVQWVIDLSTLAFRQWKALAGGSAVIVPPTWPGLANVTLGAVHVLADGMTVAGPLDGLIVKITAVPTPTGYYGFGARRSYVHVGAVIFLDDNGEAEHSQTIGLDDQVLVPRTMEHAQSAIIRLKSGTAGTVQPWTAT